MANENELKIVFGADTAPLQSDVGKASDAVQDFNKNVKKAATDSAKSFDQLKKSISGVPKAFDEIAAGKAAMDRISKSIDAAGDAALRGGQDFAKFGSRVPLQDLRQLDRLLGELKRDLSGGLGTKFTIIPPNTPQVINNTSAALGKLKSGGNSAALALNDIGRIAQDIPFGFIAIQNNLNPLLESFRRVKLETGSTSGALKAMASSIGGVGGIGLALSLASSAFLIFQNGISGFNRKTKEASDKSKEFADQLRAINDISGEAGASVHGEIAAVKALANVLVDTNSSYKERQNALERLKQVNKDYFGDLTLESASLKTLTGRVDEYTNALVQQAIIKGFSDEIGNVNRELFTQNKALDESADRLERAKKAIADFGPRTETDTRGNERLKAGAGELEAELQKANKAFTEQRDIVEKIQTNYAELNGAINNAAKEQAKYKTLQGSDLGGTKKETDALKDRIAVLEQLRSEFGLLKNEEFQLGELKIELLLRDGLKDGLNPAQIERSRQAIINEFAQRQKATYQLPISIIPQVKISPAETIDGGGVETFNQTMISKLEAAGRQAGQAYNDALSASLGARIAETLTAGIADAFVGLGEFIGNILNGEGGIAGAAQAFLSIIGNVLQQVGVQIIVASKAMVALQAALANMFANPAAGLAAGIGLVIVGQLLKNIKFDVPKFATGGLVTGPTMGLVGEAGPELIIPLSRADQFLGGNNMDISGELTVRGQDLVLAISRAMGSSSRRGGF